MRHLLANIATYTIAVLLIAGAALFAWGRSEQLVLTNEATVLAQFEPADTRSFEWRELGAASYRRNCQSCHGSEGQGWDQYPGLGEVGRLHEAPGGREYLINLHLYGLTSRRWGAPMPPMRHMRDVELAAVLNHVLTAFGGQDAGAPEASPYGPEDFASRRGRQVTPAGVGEQRP